MEFAEYALLAAVLLPVGMLVAINLLLAASGESGTLLLPSLRKRWKVEPAREAAPVAAPAPAPGGAHVELRRAA